MLFKKLIPGLKCFGEGTTCMWTSSEALGRDCFCPPLKPSENSLPGGRCCPVKPACSRAAKPSAVRGDASSGCGLSISASGKLMIISESNLKYNCYPQMYMLGKYKTWWAKVIENCRILVVKLQTTHKALFCPWGSLVYMHCFFPAYTAVPCSAHGPLPCLQAFLTARLEKCGSDLSTFYQLCSTYVYTHIHTHPCPPPLKLVSGAGLL